MPNPGQPTISQGASGDVVRRLQRALRRTPDLGLVVDGIFGPQTDQAVRQFQQGAGLAVDGIVGDQTWSVSLHAMSATLETAVGLQYAAP